MPDHRCNLHRMTLELVRKDQAQFLGNAAQIFFQMVEATKHIYNRPAIFVQNVAVLWRKMHEFSSARSKLIEIGLSYMFRQESLESVVASITWKELQCFQERRIGTVVWIPGYCKLEIAVKSFGAEDLPNYRQRDMRQINGA